MNLRTALLTQADTCTGLGSPFTGQILRNLARVLQPGTPLTNRLFAWPGDISANGASLPLRLAGALHDLVLSNTDQALRACYPPNPAPSQTQLDTAIASALRSHANRIDTWINRPPQTNEVGRSAVLIAIGHWLTHHLNHPLALSELGASAGLNLNWDKFALNITDHCFGPDHPALTLAPKWTGDLPPKTKLKITQKRGTDLTPIDPQDPDAAQRLMAYIWPDQPDRMARTRAAITVVQTKVDKADAADWLETRLTTPQPGQTHLIYHTIAWQYFPAAVKARARALIESAGSKATPQSPLAWFGLEADDKTPGAAMTLRLWPENRSFSMGRADFYGRWVDWTPKEGTLIP